MTLVLKVTNLKYEKYDITSEKINNDAPINVKLEAGGRGVGRATHGNLTLTYIFRVGILIGYHAFDLSILYSRREVSHLFLLILTILFRPGVGILISFF